GPFKIFDLEIDSEWQSNLKYNLIRPHFNLKDKIVADIGCNNGYYMFRMLEDKPKRLVGFDPSPLTLHQFEFINHFVKSDIIYEMLGVEHLELYNHKFDFIFMLGVLYHRADPVGTLKALNKGLNSKGEIIIDTFMIDGEDEICLTPNQRYSKIPNIYFIPTIPALKNWLARAGFENIEVIATVTTTKDEQRATSWSFDESLEDFLDPNDSGKTVEGYPAPKRVYVKARKVL
ncbi:MAG: tRNA 5-methoxyuridine(34)/uridine 5-oxyacetic acid(34) synthase CmoB, partial [Aliarcobacter sp.]